jgi:LPXTG-site transpeptidase (sortase) family protein
MRKKREKTTTDSKANRSKKVLSIALPILLLFSGLYLLSLVFAPKLVPYFNAADVQKAIDSSAPEKGNDRLYIQKLGVNAPVKSGDASVMNNGGVWHRLPSLGNPVEGGNFILSAHRWQTGKTPAETIAQSPFYNMDQMVVGDSIFVDFEGKRYKYEIYEIYQIKPDQTEIEAPLAIGEDPKMTLYTCTLKGAADGRVVIQARLVKL